MKKQRSHTLLYLGIGMFVLFSVVVVLIFMFMHRNRQRIIEQNQQYLEDAAEQSAKNMNTVFRNAADSVYMVANLYELQLDVLEFDYRLLNGMAENTPFDYLRFVSPEGISYSGDGNQTGISVTP